MISPTIAYNPKKTSILLKNNGMAKIILYDKDLFANIRKNKIYPVNKKIQGFIQLNIKLKKCFK